MSKTRRKNIYQFRIYFRMINVTVIELSLTYRNHNNEHEGDLPYRWPIKCLLHCYYLVCYSSCNSHTSLCEWGLTLWHYMTGLGLCTTFYIAYPKLIQQICFLSFEILLHNFNSGCFTYQSIR